MCDKKFIRFDDATMNQDKELTKEMKIHDHSHDYHNKWIIEDDSQTEFGEGN